LCKDGGGSRGTEDGQEAAPLRNGQNEGRLHPHGWGNSLGGRNALFLPDSSNIKARIS
jgi:hypothetical protein